MNDPAQPVLDVRGLCVELRTECGTARVVDNVSLSVPVAGKVALVGESGSGKTMIALSVLRLLTVSQQNSVQGQVLFKGRDLLQLPEREMRKLRGNELSMVFQEPMTALNPVLSVGYQITETLHAHQRITRKDAKLRAIELLRNVGIPSPSERVDSYPHQLSGGMRQRVLIAIAACCRPALIIADEPTTALDATLAASILDLLERLRAEDGTATLLITHDLGVVARVADHVLVMYAGQIVESASVNDLFLSPLHPYTQALLRSLPPAPGSKAPRTKNLPTIVGRVPDPTSMPRGCRFHERCPHAYDECRTVEPPWVKTNGGGFVRCWLKQPEGSGKAENGRARES